MLTGHYPDEHGAVNVKSMSLRHLFPEKSLNEKYPTIAEAMAREGYRTGAFSANPLYFTRQLGFTRGFHHFDDYFHSSGDMFFRTVYGRKFAGLMRRRIVQRALLRLNLNSLLDMKVSAVDGTPRRASAIDDAALRWMIHDRSRPFFAFLNYFDVHVPYRPPLSYPRKFGDPDPVKMFDADDYDDCIVYIDDYIGRLMKDLSAQGLDRNLLLVITSDQGEALGEHGVFYAHHSSLYREQIQVPLIFWQPGKIPRGMRIDVPVSNASIPATILDMLRRPHSTFPTPSLTPLWSSPGSHPEWPYPIAELAQGKYVRKTFPSYYGAMRSVVTRRWHFIFHDKFGTELYDWKTDRCELENLETTPTGHEVAQQLGAYVDAILAHPKPLALVGFTTNISGSVDQLLNLPHNIQIPHNCESHLLPRSETAMVE